MSENKVERIVTVAWEARKSPKDLMAAPVSCPGELARIKRILDEPPESDGKNREQVLDKANAVYLDRAYEDLTSTRSQD